jgi:hypothetical protein
VHQRSRLGAMLRVAVWGIDGNQHVVERGQTFEQASDPEYVLLKPIEHGLLVDVCFE